MNRGFLASSPRTARMDGDVALQNLRLDVRFGPQHLEELIVSHQSAGVLDEIPQYVKGPGC
jgi:hypothetical protein